MRPFHKRKSGSSILLSGTDVVYCGWIWYNSVFMGDYSHVFLKRRAIGKNLEHFLADVFRTTYKNVLVSQGEKKEYDIHIVDIDRKIECKYDMKSRFTGNIAIEYEYSNKPSGILTTEADEWMIYFYYDNKWLFSFAAVDKIRGVCEGKRIVPGGDGMKSKMFLLKAEEYLSYSFVKVSDLDKYKKKYGFNAD